MSKTHTILEKLKNSLSTENTMNVSNIEDYLAKFYFPSATNTEAIKQLQVKTQWNFPLEYIDFLLMHNGATLFMDLPHKTQYVSLYNIEAVSSYFDDYHFGVNLLKSAYPAEWYMIGEYSGFGDYFLIDSKKVQENKPDYMICVSNYSIIHLSISFDDWLEKLILNQGGRFWLWG